MPLKLLYIEDEVAHSGLLTRILDPAEWQVECRLSYQAALPLLEARWPDLVLLDLQLGSAPADEGLETLATIKAHYPTLPVVVTSVSDHTPWIRQAQASGAADFLRKPVDVETIGERLREIVQTAS
jgi:two-component system, sensor histidine kinase RpfC